MESRERRDIISIVCAAGIGRQNAPELFLLSALAAMAVSVANKLSTSVYRRSSETLDMGGSKEVLETSVFGH